MSHRTPGGTWRSKALWRLALGAGLVVVASPAGAQGVIERPDAWRWSRFTGASGLPSNRIVRLIETVGGTPWVGTDRGVAWYDGFVWRAMDSLHGLPDTTVTGLTAVGDTVFVVAGGRFFRGDTTGFVSISLPAHDQSLAFATALPDGSVLLQRLHVRTASRYRNGAVVDDSMLPGFAIRSVPQAWPAAPGEIWASTVAGIYRFGSAGWELLPAWNGVATSLGEVVTSRDGRQGVAWVRGPLDRRGLWEWRDGAPPRRAESEGVNPAVGMALGSDGTAVVAYETGDVRLRSAGRWHDLQLPTEMRDVSVLRFRANGDLWVATGNGLFLYRTSANRWTTFVEPFPSQRNRINDLLLTRDGSLWRATGGGLAVGPPGGPVRWFDRVAGLPMRNLTGLAQDTAGNIWVTSGNEFPGAVQFDGKVWRYFGPGQGLTRPVHRMTSTRDGALWLLELGDTTGGGALRFDGRSFTRPLDHPLMHSGVYALAEGTDGALYFGTRRGLLRWRDGRWTTWTTLDGLAKVDVFALAATPDNRIWISTRGGGLLALQPDGGLEHYTRSDGLVDDEVWSLAVDPGGLLWLGSHAGLGAYRNGNWLRFGLSFGLPTPFIWPLIPTADEVYLGTSRGLAVLSRREESNPPPRVVLRTAAEGVTTRFIWQPYSFWGTLPSEAIETRFRLDGSAWSAWDTRRERVFRDLPAGRHRFEVEAKGFYGQVAPASSVQLLIPPPFYRRPTIAIPLGLLILALSLLGLMAMVRKRRQDEALRRSEQRLRTLVETAPEALVIFNTAHGRFQAVNEHAVRLFGHSREELLRLSPIDLSPPTQPDGQPSTEGVRGYIESALRGETPVFEWTHRTRQGQNIPCEVRLVRLAGAEPGEWLVRGSITDITARLAIERQLRQAQKMQAVGQLTGGIAHDFNNILTAVLANTELIREGLHPDQGELRADLESIRGMARRGAALVRKLMTFSRHDPLVLRSVDLGEAVHELRTVLQRILPESIQIEVEAAHQAWIRGDLGALEQILLNLATNARDAMPEGGTLRLQVDPVHLTGEEPTPAGVLPGHYIRLVVRDTGAGMDPETLAHIFEPFFTTKAAGQGTGLGLAMVYALVEQHAGRIDVASTPTAGTTMTLYFPTDLSHGQAAEHPERAQPLGGTETLLIVEDEEAIRRATRRLLERQGYRVILAEDGHQALEVLRRYGDTVDLVLTDVVMPNMGGWQLYQEARARGCQAHFIFTSGYTAREGKMLEADPTLPFLQKPWVATDLLELVRDVLGREPSSDGPTMVAS